MRALFSALLLSLPVTALAQIPYIPAGAATNCLSPSAECLASNFTATGKLTLSGTTGPQIDSTGTSAFVLRSNAAGTTEGTFTFLGNSSQTGGYLIRIAEKAGTTAEDRVTVDHDGTLRLWPDGVWGSNLEMFGGLYQMNGGADGPFKLYGGASTTTFAGRVLSARRLVGDVQVWNLRADGTAQWTGVATGSLGTCNGSAAGSIQYDTTTNTFKACNGTDWKELAYVP
jgi:hypothetical protein